ncbi:hypothetical protein [Burkholderia multivorans]|uniref:hypothetical protein n=1 Tax=Burkholderia multivorans TaxID=87883 RepID=UPI0012DA446F|nr:hypothetical protein [Burkholderia multivorans]
MAKLKCRGWTSASCRLPVRSAGDASNSAGAIEHGEFVDLKSGRAEWLELTTRQLRRLVALAA